MSQRSSAPSEEADHLHIVLVCDHPEVEAAVRISCPPPHLLHTFPIAGLVNEQNALSTQGEAVVHAAATADVVLIEWEMNSAPVINTLCYHIRRGVLAPLVGLCRGGPYEVIAAIAAGADQAATFPLHLPLLRAYAFSYQRLTQAARTAATPPAPPADGAGLLAEAGHDVQHFGDLHLDRTAHRFLIRETEVELTPREFALLDFLMENVGTACTRDQILDQVWGINFDTGTNMVDVYMYFLRRKLEAHGVTGVIQTVRGYGYRLAAPDVAEG